MIHINLWLVTDLHSVLPGQWFTFSYCWSIIYIQLCLVNYSHSVRISQPITFSSNIDQLVSQSVLSLLSQVCPRVTELPSSPHLVSNLRPDRTTRQHASTTHFTIGSDKLFTSRRHLNVKPAQMVSPPPCDWRNIKHTRRSIKNESREIFSSNPQLISFARRLPHYCPSNQSGEPTYCEKSIVKF